MKEQLRATEEEFFLPRTESLRTAEQALTDKQNELAKLSAELSDRSTVAESRQVELVFGALPRSIRSRAVSPMPKRNSPPPRRGSKHERGESEKATARACRGTRPRRKT